jgi:glycoprotein endo-alpha-1,2-mannosidase
LKKFILSTSQNSGLYLGEGDKQRILASSFDGLYTYFAAEGFTDGSIMANWPLLSTFCAKNRLLFVPSVGPGYNDTRVRPWNAKTARDRAAGEYYKDRFKMAHTAKVFWLLIYNLKQKFI